MATYKRGTRFGVLSFARITSTTTLAQFQADPTLTADSIDFIKNKYLWQDGCKSVYLSEGDSFKYYLPLTTDNFDVDYEGFQIALLARDFSTINANIGTVSKGTYAGGEYFYIELSAPAVVQDGCTIAIYDQNASNRLYLLSNYIDFIAQSDREDYPFFKFRSTVNGYLHYWEEIISDVPTFYNQFRLDVNRIGDKYEYEIEQEKESLTGEIIDITNDVDKYIIIETYQFTEEMHGDFSILVWCDILYINDSQYVKKSGYDPETPTLNGQTKGRVELYDLDFATANKFMSV